MAPITLRIALRLKIHVSVADLAFTRPHLLPPRRAFRVMLVIYALKVLELLFLRTCQMDIFVLQGIIAHKARTFDPPQEKSLVQVVPSIASRGLQPSLTAFHALSTHMQISSHLHNVFRVAILLFPTTRPLLVSVKGKTVHFSLPPDLVVASLDTSYIKHCRVATRTQNQTPLLIARLLYLRDA